MLAFSGQSSWGSKITGEYESPWCINQDAMGRVVIELDNEQIGEFAANSIGLSAR